MKKYYLQYILFLISFQLASAQPEGQFLADSLELVLKTKDISDIGRVDILTQLCYEYRNLSPAKAIEFGNQAESLAKKIHYERKLGEIYLYQAYSLEYYNDHIKAHEYALMAIKYNTQYNMTDIIPNSKIASLFNNPNIENEAKRDSLMTILRDISKIKNKEWYIRALGAAGIALLHAQGVRTSDSLLNIAITEARKYHFKFLEMHNLARIAMKLAIEQEYDTAIILLSKVNNYLKSIQEKRILSELLNYVAYTYMQRYSLTHNKADLDSADLLMNESKQITSLLGYKKMLLYNYALSADINAEKGNLESVINDQQKYIALNDTLYGASTRRKLEAIVIKQRDEIAAGEIKLKNIQLSRQKNIRNASFGALATLLLFSIIVIRQRNRVKKEKKRSDELLLNILPEEVAEELKLKGSADARQFDEVTVMFTDFKGFTQISEKLTPAELVAEIDNCFKAFDNIIGKHNIEKIKTIGDSYMCAGGLPVVNNTNAKDIVNAALEIQQYMHQHLLQRQNENKEPFEIRIGVHTGPVVAGIVGVKKFAYDIWGDTVNIASRMEASGEAGKINISGITYELVKDNFNCTYRGKIQAKSKGEVDMYFVEGNL